KAPADLRNCMVVLTHIAEKLGLFPNARNGSSGIQSNRDYSTAVLKHSVTSVLDGERKDKRPNAPPGCPFDYQEGGWGPPDIPQENSRARAIRPRWQLRLYSTARR